MTKPRDLATLGGGFTQSGTGAIQRTVESKLKDRISVLDFIPEAEHAAIKANTSTYDCRANIKSAIVAAGVSAITWFPAGTYLISGPIDVDNVYKIDGDNATIKAATGFTGKTVNNIGAGGTTVVSALLLWLRNDYNDIGGVRRFNAIIGQGITLDCNSQANHGLYIERMPYSYIGCKCYRSVDDAIIVGLYCWGVHVDGVVIESFGDNGLVIGAAANGITISNPRIWGNTAYGASGILFTANNNSNGITIDGGLIEKCAYGISFQARTGPVEVAGIDFEDITGNVINAVGDLTSPTGRLIGPIDVTSCYLDSTGSKIIANNAIVRVHGCRIRPGTNFETLNSGIIISSNNVFEATAVNAAGAIVRVLNETNPASTATNAVVSVETANAPFLALNSAPLNAIGAELRLGNRTSTSATSAGIKAIHPDAGDADFVSIGIYVRPTGGSTDANLEIARADYAGSFRPGADNVRPLGTASFRWSQLFAGTATINTSDINVKQQIESLSAVELTVAQSLKGMIRKYKFNDAVAEKGSKARLHVGIIAQEVEQVFVDAGLEPSQYGLFCRDEWWELDGEPVPADENGVVTFVRYDKNGEVVFSDEDGNPPEGAERIEETKQATKRIRLGIRYEELLAFIISAL